MSERGKVPQAVAEVRGPHFTPTIAHSGDSANICGRQIGAERFQGDT